MQALRDCPAEGLHPEPATQPLATATPRPQSIPVTRSWRTLAPPPEQTRAVAPAGAPEGWVLSCAWVVSPPGCAGAVVSLESSEPQPAMRAAASEGQRQDSGDERHQEPTKLPARAKTASSIGSVSLPVNVFCWLGW